MYGDRIRSGRDNKHLSQSELALKVDVTRSYLAHLEKNYTTKEPPPHVTRKLAEVLDDDPDDLGEQMRTEMFLLRGAREAAQNLELLTFSCFSSMFREVQNSVKIRSFCCLPSLVVLRDDLIDALRRGVSVQVLLAKPTLGNCYKRALRSDLQAYKSEHGQLNLMNDPEGVAFQIRYHRLRLEAAFSLLKMMWQLRGNGNLSLHLYEPYTPSHYFIFDNQNAVEKQASLKTVVHTKDDTPQTLAKLCERFNGEMDLAEPFDWQIPRNEPVRFPDARSIGMLAKRQKPGRPRATEPKARSKSK